MGVGGQHLVPSGEGADQHKQRGFREMEVGEEALDDLEAVAGAEEDVGAAGVGLERVAGGQLATWAQCSSVRVVVVPAAITLRFCEMAALMAAAVEAGRV